MYIELLPIIAKLAEKFTEGTSTSVTYEQAQKLMEAVIYCIREYEKESTYGLYALASIKQLSTEEVYQKGYELTVRKVKKMRKFYNRILESFCDYGNQNYADTIQKGMPEFFRHYDARFAPQKTILTLDYPILADMEGLQGIDAIEQYLSSVALEQKFMGAFDEAYVRRILTSYDWNYQKQFYNLCEILIKNVLGCVLTAKPLEAAAEQEHYQRLKEWVSKKTKEEIYQKLDGILDRLVKEKWNENELLYEYLSQALPNITIELKMAEEHGGIDKIIPL